MNIEAATFIPAPLSLARPGHGRQRDPAVQAVDDLRAAEAVARLGHGRAGAGVRHPGRGTVRPGQAPRGAGDLLGERRLNALMNAGRAGPVRS
jgi:hypothetical protein